MDRNGMVAVGGMALISRYLFRSGRGPERATQQQVYETV